MKKNIVSRLFTALALAGVLAAVLAVSTADAQVTSTTRATELRSDKLAAAPVIATIAAGAALRVISLEGGWALVQARGQTGWVRAASLQLQAASSQAAGARNGREAATDGVVTLGVRSLVPRSNRHALIIGVSRYADPETPPLPGARIDRESATQMAQAMQVPPSNITYLQDEQATGASIRKALADLTGRVEEGDRVFIHYSGHGTRYNDPAASGCVEALLAYDGGKSGTITNHEMADLLKSITTKTDKLFVMYDACHSGGLINTPQRSRTRGLANTNDAGLLRPKFSSITEECGRPVNVKTRNLLLEATSQGALPQDIVHISAARDNEVSFDDEQKGGLATQFMRDCMLRDAKDLDGSGAISVDEIRQCAQEKLNKRMQNDANYKAHNITLSGNVAFVPAWFSQAVPARPSAAVAVAAPQAAALPVKPEAVVAPPLTGAQALQQMFDQRDAKRRVEVKAASETLKIGRDLLDFSVRSGRSGYVYVALAGSDNKSLQLIFPNALDSDNRIEAGQELALPRPSWRIRAGGPPGRDSLLVMVTDGPRSIESLASAQEGPFVVTLNDAQGRANLGALMATSRGSAAASCEIASARRNNRLCSDAYGAALFSLEEIQ